MALRAGTSKLSRAKLGSKNMVEDLAAILQPEYIILNTLCAIGFFCCVGWKIFSAKRGMQASGSLELRRAA